MNAALENPPIQTRSCLREPERARTDTHQHHFRPSPDYTALLNGKATFVHHFPGMSGGAPAWIHVLWDGKPVEVSVTATRCVDTVRIHPLARGLEGELLGKTVRFVVDRPGHLFLKWDDAFQLPFYVFVHGPQEAEPEPEDPGVLYFGPGAHYCGIIEIQSNQTLYLAPGAVVFGAVMAENAHNVRICGLGILCATDFQHGENDGIERFVLFKHCRNVTVDGITMLDSFSWNLTLLDCDDCRVTNVKILCERPWSTDGINPCSSRYVVVEDCFVRSKDDCVSVKGLNDRTSNGHVGDWSKRVPLRNVLVRDCVFWSDNNNALVVGSETWAEVIENIVFENCDILHVSNTVGDLGGALSVIGLDDSEIRNITFRNIRIEWCYGPVVNIFFPEEIFRIPGNRRSGSVIRDVRFINVSVQGGPERRSFIRGADATRTIANVSFDHFILHGRHVLKPEDARMEINEYASQPRFC